MRGALPVCLASLAIVLSGCAAKEAVSVEPTAAAPTPTPRPTAVAGLDSRSPATIVHRVDTKKKVVFLTIDDGLDADRRTLEYLQDNNIPATVFLTTGTVTDWDYWQDFSSVASIQNHTIMHPTLTSLSETGEEQEICGANEAIESELSATPWMMRPPYGAYNASTLAAAGECGLDYVVHWSVTAPGDTLQYQAVGASLEPGDIVLTHFRPDLKQDLPKLVKEIRGLGFEIARLEDYLTPRGWAKAADPADMQMDTATESRAYLVQD